MNKTALITGVTGQDGAYLAESEATLYKVISQTLQISHV